MQNLIKYLTSLAFIFLLFPMSVFAGEVVKVECTNSNGPFTSLIDSDGGKQLLFSQPSPWNVGFAKDGIFGADKNGNGFFINFVTGEFLNNSNKYADCKFPNIEVLENNNTVDAVMNTVDAVMIEKEVEYIEAECHDPEMNYFDSETMLFLLDTAGGKQTFLGEEADIVFTKDKVVINDSYGNQGIMDFKSGKMYINGKKAADCEFSNLEALN